MKYVADFSHFVIVSQVTCQNEWFHYGAQLKESGRPEGKVGGIL